MLLSNCLKSRTPVSFENCPFIRPLGSFFNQLLKWVASDITSVFVKCFLGMCFKACHVQKDCLNSSASCISFLSIKA